MSHEAYKARWHRVVFIGGLHRSGTTLLARSIGEHPAVSCLEDTHVPEDEGQHLQDVYPVAEAFGGPGRFGFSPRMHMTEKSDMNCNSRTRLLTSWTPFWDLSKPVLVEKSPPNLIKMRFLQSIFPTARFLILVRHPIAVAMATQKWSQTSVLSLLRHWVICHDYFLRDAAKLRKVQVVRYEEFVSKPRRTLKQIFNFLDIGDVKFEIEVRRNSNEQYLRRWESQNQTAKIVDHLARIEPVANVFGYSIMSPREQVRPSATVRSLLTWPRTE